MAKWEAGIVEYVAVVAKKKRSLKGGRPGHNRKRWTIWLNEQDFENIDLIKNSNGDSDRADAVRKTLHREASRIRRNQKRADQSGD